MQAKSSYELVKVGLAIRFLYATTSNSSAKNSLDVINGLRNALEAAEFNVSLEGMSLFDEIEEELNTLGNEGELSHKLAERLSEMALSVERIIYAEANTKKIYWLPTRRFNSNYLLSEPNKLLREGCFGRLSNIAQSDLSSAGRCILFGEATAAAFHMLRATEEALKQYYFFHRRKNRLSKPMWANMVSQLRAKKTNKPPAILLDSLDMVRVSYRNPTQHPEATYDIEGAQDLFGVCLDVIGRMAVELPDPTN